MAVFLIVASSIIGLLLIGVNFYILALYCHPQDNGFGASLYCKFLVVLGFTLAWGQVLLVSADVAASKGFFQPGSAMITMWYVVYCTIFAMIALLIPFAQFFYETDDEKTLGKRILEAICFESILLAILVTLLMIGFVYLKTANIPVETISQAFISDTSTAFVTGVTTQSITETTVSIDVSFPVFTMGFMAFIGWFLFVLFGGVGLSALPMDLIEEYRNRPQMIKSGDAAVKKGLIKRTVTQLIELGAEIKEEEKEIALVNGFFSKRKVKNQVSVKAKKFEAAVLALEAQHEIFKFELNYENTNPIVWVFKLILGIIFSLLSILWFFQILLYILIKPNGFPVSSFLNAIFTYLEGTIVSFIGAILLSMFSIYLLACTYKGNIKFGLRIPFLFTIHPMKENETFMNSFLFNVNLLLITSVAVTQFVCVAFSEYVSNSQIAVMFLGQIQYLGFFNWFFEYNVFEISLICWAFIVMIYLLVRPMPKSQALLDYENRKNAVKDIELQQK